MGSVNLKGNPANLPSEDPGVEELIYVSRMTSELYGLVRGANEPLLNHLFQMLLLEIDTVMEKRGYPQK